MDKYTPGHASEYQSQDTHLIDSLIQNMPTHTSSPQYDAMHSEVFGDQSIAMSRVVSIRYRMYTIALLLLALLGLFNFLLPSIDAWDQAQVSYDATYNQLQSIDLQIQQTQQNTQLINSIIAHEDLIIDCLQVLSGCENIPPQIQQLFSVARSYVLINNLHEPRMLVDEKRILASLNEFLLRRNAPQRGRVRNGDVEKIVIGNPQVVMDNLYRVPVDVQILFADTDGLLSFINNVEIALFFQHDQRVLYKINEIDYNIIQYQQPQSVSIKMDAYSYHINI